SERWFQSRHAPLTRTLTWSCCASVPSPPRWAAGAEFRRVVRGELPDALLPGKPARVEHGYLGTPAHATPTGYRGECAHQRLARRPNRLALACLIWTRIVLCWAAPAERGWCGLSAHRRSLASGVDWPRH